jgi:hypothetical protein
MGFESGLWHFLPLIASLLTVPLPSAMAAAPAASSTAAVTTVTPTQQPAPASQAQKPPPAPAATGGAVPVGTIVTALPTGCTTAPEAGVQYYRCNGTRYRVAFQGNNLVYVAQ